MFFLLNNETKQRAFRVAGIYETGLIDGFDDLFLLCDIRQVQKLNNWEENSVAGFEVLVNSYEVLDEVTATINNTIDANLNAKSIKELTPQIFFLAGCVGCECDYHNCAPFICKHDQYD